MNNKTSEPKHEKRIPTASLPVSKWGYEEIAKIARYTDTPIELVVREMVHDFVSAWNVTGQPNPTMVGQKEADMFRKQGEENAAMKHRQDFSKGWEE